MWKLRTLILVFSFLKISQSFDKDEFLKSCTKTVSFYHKEQIDCLHCANFEISNQDSEHFKDNNFEITKSECVLFDGVNAGIVNSDFFKQFPETIFMSFTRVNMSLKSSDNIENQSKIEKIEMRASHISENRQTNALHALINLKEFEMTLCSMDESTIDNMFFEKNHNLERVHLEDKRKTLKTKNENLLKNISENIFENNPNLLEIHLTIDDFNTVPSSIFEGKKNLQSVEIFAKLTKFPENLPKSITVLKIGFSKIKHISRDNFKSLKNIVELTFMSSELEQIDENTFDDLENLESLNLPFNRIKDFNSNYLKNKIKMKQVQIFGNPCTVKVDLSDLGFVKLGNGYFYRGK